MHRWFSSSRLWAMICGLLLTIIFAALSIVPPKGLQSVLQRIDYLTYDWRLNVSMPHAIKPRFPIVIVDIDEKSLQAEGRWPWTRDKIARLVQQLYAQGAIVIAFDVLFSESERNIVEALLTKLPANIVLPLNTLQTLKQITPTFANDEILANILQQHSQAAVLGLFFSGAAIPSVGVLPPPSVNLQQINAVDLVVPPMRSYIANIPVLQKAAQQAGALSIVPDADGVIRRYSLLQRYQNNLYPSLALEAARLYLLDPHIKIQTSKIGLRRVIDSIQLGNTTIVTDEQGRVFIPYLGAAHTFPYYSATDVLNGRLPPKLLKNALVFVGTSAVGLGDMRSTPVQSVYPGVEVHATMAEALFSPHFPYIPAWAPGAQLSWLVLAGVILSIVFAIIAPWWIIILSILLMASIASGSVWLWQQANMVVPIILPLLEVLILAVFNMGFGFFTATRQRIELKRAFEQYVPAGHVAEIMKHPEVASTFEGERKVMSVLFMDIRNFTAITEKLPIVALKKLLNLFLTEMTQVIFNHGGTVDKYVGDMVMAFWGAPLSDKAHAKHALLAGLAMLQATEKLQAQLIEMQLPSVRIGVGINTGVMDVGDMGSQFRRAYTVLGDAVNLASRLESLTKYYGVGMIVGETTCEGQDEFLFRQLDRVRVKGKQQGLAIYQPVGLRSDITADRQKEIDLHQQALSAYFSQQWQKAQQLFTQLQQQFPDTLLYTLFLDRIKYFQTTPPPADWDGVWEHHEK